MPPIDLDAIAKSLAPDHDAPTDRSESALLVDLIDSIDDAIARGVPRATVLARLHDGGFTMSLPTFIKALQRIRKRLGRPAPRRRSNARASNSTAVETPTAVRPRHTRPSTAPHPVQPDPPRRTPGEPIIRSREELQRENPTLSSVQISKLFAQQYADPVISMEEIEALKRRFNPPTVKR